MISLALARSLYLVLGLAAILMVTMHTWEGLRGSRFDPPLAALGAALGLLSIATGAWVASAGRWRRLTAWLGIIPLPAGALYLLGIALTSAHDAIILALVPVVIIGAAALRLALARRHADRRKAHAI